MDNYIDFQNMPNYVSIKEAAKMLDISPNRVYEFVTEGRLKGVWAADVIMIPREEVEQFKRGPTGRPRKNTPAWRISAGANIQYMTFIFVQLRSGRLDAFVQKLEEMRKKRHHTFTGTVARYIVEDDQKPDRVHISLVWRGTVMPDEATREQALKAFREALDDVLDWETAEYHHGRVFMHT
jgi:Helix-turn-helix domain